MAEGRMLKKAISTSRRLADLKTDSARMLYTWIIPHLDVEGRFYADPSMIKGSVVPRVKDFDEVKIQDCLTDMANVGLIILYIIDGDLYLQLRKFEDHQNIKKEREAPSKIPPPLKDNSGPNQENSGVNQEQIKNSTAQDKIREEKLREAKLRGAREELPVDNSRSKEPVEDKPKPKNTHGERWTDEQGETLDELLGDIRNRYGARYHQQVYVFIQSNFNKKNPDAVLHALKRLISDRLAGKAIPLPGKWLESVLNGNGKHPGENGKFEAQESEREHEALKRDESRDVAKMIQGIGRAP